MDFRKKVKNVIKNKVYIVVCNGIEKLKRVNAVCRIEGVIVDLRETVCFKKRLIFRNKS